MNILQMGKTSSVVCIQQIIVMQLILKHESYLASYWRSRSIEAALTIVVKFLELLVACDNGDSILHVGVKVSVVLLNHFEVVH